jgi:hypothetical protein
MQGLADGMRCILLRIAIDVAGAGGCDGWLLFLLLQYFWRGSHAEEWFHHPTKTPELAYDQPWRL